MHQLDLQRRRRCGRRLAVGVEGDRAAFDTQLQRTDVEAQVDVLGLHVRGQRQAGALATDGVVILQADLQRVGRVRQAQAQAQLQVGTEVQPDAAGARGVQELVETSGQRQTVAGQRHQARQVEVQRQGLAVVQAQVEVDVELVRRAVQAQVQHLGLQAQGLLDQQFGPVQAG